MNIRQWHPGKIVLVWVAAVLLLLLAFRIAGAYTNEKDITGWVIVILGLAGPVAGFVISWIWFGGRERK